MYFRTFNPQHYIDYKEMLTRMSGSNEPVSGLHFFGISAYLLIYLYTRFPEA
jgi:hypothetical protein